MAGKLTDDKAMSASRLPGLLGFSKYSTPNDELQFSISAIDGKERPDIGNEAMAWGNTLEPVILGQACERLGINGKFDITEPYKHSEIPLQCSLDGIGFGNGKTLTSDPEKGIYVVGQDSITLDGDGVLEAKLTKVMPEETPDLARGPIQLQGQMLVTGMKWGAVCVLYQGIEMRVFLFAPHPGTQEKIKQACVDFQAKLEKYKSSAEIDWYPPSSSKEIDGMFPVAIDEQIQLPTEADAIIESIINNKAQIKAAESAIEKAEMILKQYIGQSTKAVTGRYEVKWGMRSFKAQPEKLVPAKEAYTIRQSTLTIKEK